jgi:hypothetical protein
MSTQANPPKNIPNTVPNPKKTGVSSIAPARLPNADIQTTLFVISNLAAPDIPRRKSNPSARIAMATRMTMIVIPIFSKPVMNAYKITSIRIMIVPGIPNIVEKIPANNIKIKMLNPAISRGVTRYFFFFEVDG